MTRARRPILYLYRQRGAYMVNVLIPPKLYVPYVRAAVSASGVWLPLRLGPDPRHARRRLRSVLRAWGGPGCAVRDACAWFGRTRAADPSWPWTSP